MEGWLNVTKSVVDDVPVPMAATRESADDIGGEPGICRSGCRGVPVCPGGIILIFSLVI